MTRLIISIHSLAKQKVFIRAVLIQLQMSAHRSSPVRVMAPVVPIRVYTLRSNTTSGDKLCIADKVTDSLDMLHPLISRRAGRSDCLQVKVYLRD